jgi:hypothetical protein
MAKYEATGKSWLTLDKARGPRLIREGEKFDYEGWPNAQMVPLDKEAEANVDLLPIARQRYGGKLPPTPEECRKTMKTDKVPEPAPKDKDDRFGHKDDDKLGAKGKGRDD